MIHEIDDALRTLIKRDALKGTEVEVVFDAPTKDWSSRRNAPTADIYLYDIREDVRRRQVGRSDVRDDEARVTSRVQPPRWFKLSYLVTAWTQRPEDEHRLLAAMLRCFLQFDAIPRDLLTGTLGALRESIPITCALPPPEDRALSDVWSALGGELKPSLDLVVIAPFDLTTEIEVGPPVMEEPRIVVAPGFVHPDGTGSGDQTDAAAAPAAAGTGGGGRHRGRERGRPQSETPAADDQPATAGSASGSGSGSGSGASSAEDAGGAPAPAPVAAEEVSAGRGNHPGRRLRITELPR